MTSLAFVSQKKTSDSIDNLTTNLSCSHCSDGFLIRILYFKTSDQRSLSLFHCSSCSHFQCFRNQSVDIMKANTKPLAYLKFYDATVDSTSSCIPKVENVTIESNQDGLEQYEKMNIPGWTKYFKSFQKSVLEEPEQVIRYHWKGQPLFYGQDSVSDQLLKSGPPPCAHCGSKRVFECQLMPYFHRILPLPSSKSLSDFKNVQDFYRHLKEWGTILIYSCEKDCGTSSAAVQEYVAVQWEE